MFITERMTRRAKAQPAPDICRKIGGNRCITGGFYTGMRISTGFQCVVTRLIVESVESSESARDLLPDIIYAAGKDMVFAGECLDLPDRVKNGAVIPAAELFPDHHKGQVGHLAAEEH